MFKFADRNEKQYLVLVAGWAFDYRIFNSLDLPYNYCFFEGDSIASFEGQVKRLMQEKNLEKISIFGFSQGAFAASLFAAANPDKVSELILVGLRKKYDEKDLQSIKSYLARNPSAFLYSFYKDCFCRQERKAYLLFKRTLFKDYLAHLSTDRLAEALDWLSQVEITPQSLEKIKKIKIVHGTEDAIAPLSEAEDIARSLPQA
ncbi:MAG: alpha/beta fold hydrolase, partial [Planctomycetota bacterium]